MEPIKTIIGGVMLIIPLATLALTYRAGAQDTIMWLLGAAVFFAGAVLLYYGNKENQNQ